MILTKDDIKLKLNMGLESALELCNKKLNEINTIGLSCYRDKVKAYEEAIAASENRLEKLQQEAYDISNNISCLQIKYDLFHGFQDAKLLEHYKLSLYENKGEISRLTSSIESYKNSIQMVRSEFLKPVSAIAYKLNKIAEKIQDRLYYNDTYLVDYLWSAYQVLILGKDGNYMLYNPYRSIKNIPGMTDQINATMHELFPWFTSKSETDYAFDQLKDWTAPPEKSYIGVGMPGRIKPYDDPDPFMTDANDACFHRMIEELILGGSINSISANKLG